MGAEVTTFNIAMRVNSTMLVQDKPHQISTRSPNGHIDIKSLNVPADIKYLIQHGDSIGQYSTYFQALSAVLLALVGAGYDDSVIASLCLIEAHGISKVPREKGPAWLRQELMKIRRQADNLARQAQGEPEDLDDLMMDTILPPRPIIEDLLYEGMLLFGGKSKRGKSWLMLDLAISVATGTPVWGYFVVPEPQPVLYISLEDGRGRIKQRVDEIRPGVKAQGYLQFLYSFPVLDQGGLEKLRGYMENGRYRLIIIDVLAKIEPAAKGGSEKTYLEIYDMFAPLQDLRRDNPLCVAMITHLRKAEAEDIFDTLHGSVGYQGVQDALWAMERPPRNDVAVLHTRPNDGKEQVLHVAFRNGRCEFLGHDEEVTHSQECQDILDLIEEHDKSLSISQVNRFLLQPRNRYRATQMRMHRMSRDGILVRVGRGQYDSARRLKGGENVTT